MRIVVCLDDQGGMCFNGRRQSKDRILRERLLDFAAGKTLWMNAYSAGQFPGEERIRVDEAFLEKAGTEDLCFVENRDISDYAPRVTGVILFRWNRSYPRDVIFPTCLFSSRWQLISSEEFAGSSHERITQEVYAL